MIYAWLKFAHNERLGDIFGRYRGIGPGFDLLRILLALAIFFGHTKWIAGQAGMVIVPPVADVAHLAGEVRSSAAAATDGAQWVGWTKPFKLALVPMFFGLSGFLVMGSAARLRSTSTFLAHRALRIFPALIVEVTLSAFVLGAFLTSLPLGQYLSSPVFLRYLGNAVGYIWFSLPGVFTGNPVSGIVNINLWTLPSEFYCYLIMAALMLTRLVYNRQIFTWVVAGMTIYLAGTHFLTGASTPVGGPYPAHVIVYYFFVGVLFYHWQDRIPARLDLVLLAAPLTYICLMDNRLIYLAPPMILYLVLFFGLLPLPKFRLLSTGDYSYGVYLYGFPIAQALVAIWPEFFSRNFALLLPVSLGTTIFFSVCSWHLVEKHAMALKKTLPTTWFPVPSRERPFETVAPAITGRLER